VKPFRALVLVAVGAAFWGGLRAATIRQEVARQFEPVVATIPTPIAPADPAGATPIITAPRDGRGAIGVPAGPAPHSPEVMVYSYPGPGDAGTPAPLYRLRARRVAENPGMTDPAQQSAASPAMPGAAFPINAAPGQPPSPPPPRETPPDMQAAAYDAATRAYAYLRAGDGRAATSAFAVALSLAPDHPRAAAWRKEKARLSRWWRAEAYVFQRGTDGTLIRSPGLPAASNVLGGGQEAGLIAVTPNPFGQVRVELQARYAVPVNGFTKPDPGRGQAAIGIAIKPLRKVPITLVAERLIKLGSLARNDFQIRAYGGTSRRVRGFDVSLFGEAGVVGKRPDSFAGAQMLVEKPVRLPGDLDLGLGVGAWGAMQRTDHVVDRFDVGPTLRISHPKSPVQLRVDYRVHVAGNARPGSGVALTVSSRY
jgi:hypothetical protein